MTAPDPRRCGWMADQPDGEVCGERAVVAVAASVRTEFPTIDRKSSEITGSLGDAQIALLFLCERHNFPAREAG